MGDRERGGGGGSGYGDLPLAEPAAAFFGRIILSILHKWDET